MMKFLNRTSDRRAAPTDDAAAAHRLKAVTGRGKDECGLYPARLEPPQGQRVRRLFWTPDELAEVRC